MISDPQAFAREWCNAWNRHDIEAVLAHFAEDVLFTSPVARRVVPETGGVVRGKVALRSYWQRALAQVPDLHFTTIGVYEGVDTIVIHYRNQLGANVCEVLHFEGALVRDGHGTYLP
jgi:ketosteroid isomerase-like protein